MSDLEDRLIAKIAKHRCTCNQHSGGPCLYDQLQAIIKGPTKETAVRDPFDGKSHVDTLGEVFRAKMDDVFISAIFAGEEIGQDDS